MDRGRGEEDAVCSSSRVTDQEGNVYILSQRTDTCLLPLSISSRRKLQRLYERLACCTDERKGTPVGVEPPHTRALRQTQPGSR